MEEDIYSSFVDEITRPGQFSKRVVYRGNNMPFTITPSFLSCDFIPLRNRVPFSTQERSVRWDLIFDLKVAELLAGMLLSTSGRCTDDSPTLRSAWVPDASLMAML